VKSSTALLNTLVVVLAGCLLAFAGSQGSVRAGALPTFALCVMLAFAIQWIAFVPAYALQTEKFFDLTGSVTYLVTLVAALILGNGDPRSMLLALLIAIWAVRLGSFLFSRIHAAGSDRRFDRIKPNCPMFLMTWTLQGLWVSLTAACALAAMTSIATEPLGIFAITGGLVWLLGLAIEVVADNQKSRFRTREENKDAFITSGLWAWSRHPNYFGEITLWIGIAVIALPVLSGWQLATLISPVFVYVLLTRISGVRMLEARADRTWGEDAAYQAYKAATRPIMLKKPD
jgi:steroid 5-alpha reductase family enzyme